MWDCEDEDQDEREDEAAVATMAVAAAAALLVKRARGLVQLARQQVSRPSSESDHDRRLGPDSQTLASLACRDLSRAIDVGSLPAAQLADVYPSRSLASPTETLGEAHLSLLNVRTELHRVAGRGRAAPTRGGCVRRLVGRGHAAAGLDRLGADPRTRSDGAPNWPLCSWRGHCSRASSRGPRLDICRTRSRPSSSR